MFRKRPKFVPAIGIMIGQCRKLTADLESQLREFTAAVRANDACVTKILRHVDLAHYDPRTARDDYTRISVGRDTYYGHPSIVSDGLPELPVEQAAVFEEYLRLMHGQVPDPTAMERLSPVQRLAMRGLIQTLTRWNWQHSETVNRCAAHIETWYGEQLAQVTPTSLRRCWEAACRGENGWKKPLILERLAQGAAAGFTVDVIFDLWDPTEMPEQMTDWVRQQVETASSRETL